MRVALNVLHFLYCCWRSLRAFVCIFYLDGRDALLRRAKARTELEELAVEQKRLEIESQRANNVIELVQKVEKIKDPQLRERARAAVLATGRIMPPSDGAAA
jgi:hypothetical protein